MQLADIPVPTTPAATAALAVVTRFSPPALVNHCLRAYLLAQSRAQLDGLDVDAELLYVASMLHDLALEAPFDSHQLPFEEAGGHLAWVFTAGCGWSVERCDHADAIIVAHMVGADPGVDPEGHLLDIATGLDISGRDQEGWPRELLVELVETYPRLDLGSRFLACFRDQAARKPASAAGQAVANGIAGRLANNPLESL